MQIGRTLRAARWGEVVLALLAAGGLVFTWLWVRAAFGMANRGFDLTDEGSYVLAYRWWKTNFRNYTGTQFFYGPIFQLLGWDIARLRIVRIATILAANGAFGFAFMDWLRLRRPRASKSSLWELAGVAAILGGSGMLMAWLPLSPGYNDMGLLGAVLASTIVLRIAIRVETDKPIGRVLPLAFGPVLAFTLLAKWSSLITTFTPVVLVATIVLSQRGVREIVRTFAWAIGGTVVTFLLIHIFIARLDRAIPEMMVVNKLIAQTGNSPKKLLDLYWETSVQMLKTALERHELLVIAAAVAAVARRRPSQIVAGLIGYVAVTRFLERVKQDYGFNGGTQNLGRYTVPIVALALAALTMLVVSVVTSLLTRARRPSIATESVRGWAVLALVAGIPITHGFGTGNPIYTMMVNGFSAWIAVTIAIATGLDREGAAGRWFGCVLAALGVYSAVAITKNGLLEHPYRVDTFVAATERAPGVPRLARMKLNHDKAYRWSTLHHALAPYLDPPGRAIMAYDELAGLTFFLDGQPVGEAWYSSLDRPRTAENLRASCRGGHPWWESRWPLLVFQRPVSDIEIQGLKDCGIDFATQYKLVAPASQTINLQVYAPTSEVVARSGSAP